MTGVITRRKAGMTLVEVMIASLILALTLFAFVSTFTMARHAEYRADDTSEAMHNARKEVETLMNADYSDTSLDIGTHTQTRPSYNLAYTVSSTTNGYKDISLSVSWRDSATSRTSTVSYAFSMAQSLH